MKTNKPILCFCVGLPGSGKSYWAEANKEELNAVVHSSDEIREELTGDVNEQSKNELVFSTLHKRVKEDLLNRTILKDGLSDFGGSFVSGGAYEFTSWYANKVFDQF